MIKHIKGDIFESDAYAILHQVNCRGVMGSGIAKQVKEKYPVVFLRYKEICEQHSGNPKDLLGLVLAISVKGGCTGFIANLFAQDNFGRDNNLYTNYDALKKCFERANEMFYGKTVAIPYKIGCCRGGGDWGIVYKMIEESFVDCDVVLYEYDKG